LLSVRKATVLIRDLALAILEDDGGD